MRASCLAARSAVGRSARKLSHCHEPSSHSVMNVPSTCAGAPGVLFWWTRGDCMAHNHVRLLCDCRAWLHNLQQLFLAPLAGGKHLGNFHG